MVVVIVIMGVSGCGKTTIGKGLARRLGWRFYDGDDYHSSENITKMANETPLDDDDRITWLQRLHDIISDHLKKNSPAVLACSALKEGYRNILRGRERDRVKFVYLQGKGDIILQRMKARQDHYMKEGMLQSQFDSLEEPGCDDAIFIDIALSVEDQITLLTKRLEEYSAESHELAYLKSVAICDAIR